MKMKINKFWIVFGIVILIGSFVTAQVLLPNFDFSKLYGDTTFYDEVNKICETSDCIVTAPPRGFFIKHSDNTIEFIEVIEVTTTNPENFEVLKEDYEPKITPQL